MPTNYSDPQFAEFLAAYGGSPEEAAISDIFLPGVISKRFEAFHNKTRFVHYTTADTAVAILRNKSVWLRNATAMNDYSELHHGISRVISFFGNPSGAPFWQRLEDAHVGLAKETKDLYDGWLNDLKYNTYMICVSEHRAAEDTNGRLSMWRAYGQPNGVALILNASVFHNSSDALRSYSHPVFYYSDDVVQSRFQSIVSTFVSSQAWCALPRDELKGYVHRMLETFSLGLKHPGFGEELEWRVVHRPGQAKSDRVPSSIQIIRGVPQRIHSIPLKPLEDSSILGLDLGELVDRIIVGPCQHPLMIREALVEELSAAGAADANNKVVVSCIPLRT